MSVRERKFWSGQKCLVSLKHASITPAEAAVVVILTGSLLASAAVSSTRSSPRPETSVATEIKAEIVPESTAALEDVIATDSDVVMLARLADSVARSRSDEVKKVVMWVAINRAEDSSHGYGGSLREEIMRPKQWQQFDPSATYLESTLLLADEVYKTWKDGGPRPIYNDMLWFVLNSDGSITVRNQFKDGKNRVEATFGQ